MNRMDCFKKQPSPFHYGGTHRIPTYDHYPITHEKVMAVVSKEWASVGGIARKIPRSVRPHLQTIRRHLNDALKVGEVVMRMNNGVVEWRRK